MTLLPIHKCPICKDEWVPSPQRDVLLPPCGCYGGPSVENVAPKIPCWNCGLEHMKNCKKQPMKS